MVQYSLESHFLGHGTVKGTIMGIFTKLFGTRSEREVKKIMPLVQRVLDLEQEYRALSDEALTAKTGEFRSRLAAGETLDDLLPEAFATAWLNLFTEGKAKAGDTLLITGGNSGLASVTIRLAKAFGLRVIATVRSAQKAEAIRALGADRIVDTSQMSLVDALKEEQV